VPPFVSNLLHAAGLLGLEELVGKESVVERDPLLAQAHDDLTQLTHPGRERPGLRRLLQSVVQGAVDLATGHAGAHSPPEPMVGKAPALTVEIPDPAVHPVATLGRLLRLMRVVGVRRSGTLLSPLPRGAAH
jgi:hypothetical protein